MKPSHSRLFPLLACVVLACALLLCACGASSGGAASMAATGEPDYGATPGSTELEGGAPGENPTLTQPQDSRKVVVTAHLYIEALRFDDTCRELQNAALETGGYISSTNIQSGDVAGSRYASFTMKIPAGRYTEFIQRAEGAGNMTNRNEQSDDVTDQYVDLEARLTSLRAQEARLLEMMEQATKLSDIIEIQNQLTEVQYEIEGYQGYKNQLDNLVAYCTVHIDVQEVQQVTEPVEESYWGKVAQVFAESWRTTGRVFQAIGLVLVMLLPLIVIAVIVLVVVLVIVKSNKKKRANNPPAAKPQAPPAQNAPSYYPGAPYHPYPPYPAPRVGPPVAPPPPQTPAAIPPKSEDTPGDATPAKAEDTPAQEAGDTAPPTQNNGDTPD